MYRILNFFNEKILFPFGDLILGTTFSSKLRVVRDVSCLPEQELEALQKLKLQKLLNYASSNSRYYATVAWNKDDDVLKSLKSFPVLTKSILRQQETNLLTKPIKDCILYETSGSSGIATRVYVDKEEESLFRAILINWWEWTGYYLGKPILQTGITPERGLIKIFKDFFTNTVYINAFYLKENEVLEVLQKVAGKKNMHFGGYASSLYVIAQIAERNGVQIKFDAVISWGDKLFDHYKELIERVFNTTVFENYACNEGIMIGQKVDLPYFYIYTPSVFVEILDDKDNEVEDGTIGRVIVTKLDGYAMPLIRYETGDLAVKLPRNKYPLSRKFGFPLLERVIGRDTDIIKTPEGNSLIVHTFTGIFEFYKEIEQFKIIQRNIDSITIEYIPAISFKPEVLATIEAVIRTRAKTTMRIDWQKVNHIAPTKSGKPQIIVNELINAERKQR